MRLLTVLLALSALACQIPDPEVIIMEAVAEEAAEEPQEEEPGWVPEPGMIYILDAADAIMREYDSSGDSRGYQGLWRAVQYTVEIHNVIYADDLWHMIGGGPL